MMNALGYIAGTLLAPNLAGYLISKGMMLPASIFV